MAISPPPIVRGVSTFRHRLLVFTLLGMVVAITLIPYVVMVSTSLKASGQVFTATPEVLPRAPRLDAYAEVIAREPIARYLLNSAVMATAETVGVIVTSVLAGYALARLRFWGRDVVFLVVLGTMMVPTQVTLIPSFILMRWLGWIDTYQGLIVPRLVTAFGMFLIRQFFLTIPSDFEDAARIDGCGRLRFLTQILLPLSGPALATLAIFTFTNSWNEFFWPLLVSRSAEMRTIQVAIATLKGGEVVEWNLLMAVATLSTIPTALVYLVFQRFFVRGIAMSGIKG